jgi:hypothetical protein
MSVSDTVAQRLVEIGKIESADAMADIRCDVGGVNRTDGRAHLESAGECWLTGDTVAGRAITKPRQVGAALYERRVACRSERALLAGQLVAGVSDRYRHD